MSTAHIEVSHEFVIESVAELVDYHRSAIGLAVASKERCTRACAKIVFPIPGSPRHQNMHSLPVGICRWSHDWNVAVSRSH